MKGISRREFGLLCFLLFLFLFCSAKSSHLDVVSQIRNEVKPRENGEQKNNTEIERTTGKGTPQENEFAAASKAIFEIGKALKPEMASITDNSITTIDSISRCCKKFPEACEANKRVVELQGLIRNTADLIQNIQLEALNLQKWTESTQSQFSLMIIELGKIIQDSEMVLKSVSPETMDQINKKTSDIKKTIEEKIKGGEKVEYVEISTMLKQAFKSVISDSMPIFGILLESIPKVIEFATDRVANRTAKALDEQINKPPSNQPLESQGWLDKSRNQISRDLAIIKNTLQAKYSKATQTLNKVSEDVTLLQNLLSTGNKLYRKVNSAKSCYKKTNYVLDAAGELNNASRIMEIVLGEVRSSKRIIEEAWSLMQSHLTNKALGNDLNHINKMLKDISMSNPEIELMSVQIENFLRITKGKASEEMTYKALEGLTRVIRQSEFTINCYITKIQLINYVITECSKGTTDINELYEQGVAMLDTDANQCEGKLGIVHISKDVFKKKLPQIAQVKKFNPICVLNSRMKKEYCCQLYSNGFSVEDVAKKMKLSIEIVKQIIANCPQQSIPPTMKKAICKLRKMMSNEKIAEILKLDVNDVKGVEC